MILHKKEIEARVKRTFIKKGKNGAEKVSCSDFLLLH